jgi:hypothetical protein
METHVEEVELPPLSTDSSPVQSLTLSPSPSSRYILDDLDQSWCQWILPLQLTHIPRLDQYGHTEKKTKTTTDKSIQERVHEIKSDTATPSSP